jgi:hypothetical protein
MPNKLVKGFAWVAFPDVFGLDVTEVADPGHPFAFSAGQVSAPPEVVYFRPACSGDAGVNNEFHPHSYLVLTKTQLHPKVCNGWDSDPAMLTEKYKTEDGKVKMLRVIGLHHRNRGDLVECELKIEEGA